MARRSARDWAADLGLFVFAAAFSVVTAEEAIAGRPLTDQALAWDQATGAAACAALFLRRRHPVALALALLVLGRYSHLVTGPALVALFTVAVHARPAAVRWVAVAAFLPLPVFLLSRPDFDARTTSAAIGYFAFVCAAYGWGLYTRSRRSLIAELRDRAARAGDEGRRRAREDIAREMHDVLAHRLSLLSLHAGALEYNKAASPEEVRGAAGVIRDNAHLALQDLRDVIGVLRADETSTRPLPSLTDVPGLVEESRRAGDRVLLTMDAKDEPPATVGRTAYRIVQEGLTNARKHAPDTEVEVTVTGSPGRGLTVLVDNPLRGGAPPSPVPGSGTGLAGLAERAALAGGSFEHSGDAGRFRLTARLPWPEPAAAP